MPRKRARFILSPFSARFSNIKPSAPRHPTQGALGRGAGAAATYCCGLGAGIGVGLLLRVSKLSPLGAGSE